VPQMLAAGIPVGLGTDSVASNNSHCMFTEMKFAALAFKQASQDPTVVSAHQAIRMATLHSAEAMGLGDVIGSLETGKAADMIAVNLMHPATQPVYHPASQLVYSVGREQVSDVWVNGTPLLKNHAFTKLPLKKVMQKTKNWGLKINNRMEQNKQANN
jgi:5-methylthioadenosine/S-adenosylhomocysteine deaminase